VDDGAIGGRRRNLSGSKTFALTFSTYWSHAQLAQVVVGGAEIGLRPFAVDGTDAPQETGSFPAS